MPSLDRSDLVRFQQLERSYEDVLRKVKKMWDTLLSKARRENTDEQKPPVGENNA